MIKNGQSLRMVIMAPDIGEIITQRNWQLPIKGIPDLDTIKISISATISLLFGAVLTQIEQVTDVYVVYTDVLFYVFMGVGIIFNIILESSDNQSEIKINVKYILYSLGCGAFFGILLLGMKDSGFSWLQGKSFYIITLFVAVCSPTFGYMLSRIFRYWREQGYKEIGQAVVRGVSNRIEKSIGGEKNEPRYYENEPPYVNEYNDEFQDHGNRG